MDEIDMMNALGLDGSKPPKPKADFVIGEKSQLTIEECRKILGDQAIGFTDEQIGDLRNRLEKVAAAMFDRVVSEDPHDVHQHVWELSATEEDLAEWNREVD